MGQDNQDAMLAQDATTASTRSNGGLLDLYRTMRRIRTFEERVGELFLRGSSAGSMLHLSIGEEAAAAGVCAVMRPEDNFTTHHRGHGIFLARGAEPRRMMAEIAGKKSGYCAGKGGSMHIADRALGHLGANAIVGGGIPAAVGAGLSTKALKRSGISVAFFGDGAMQQGILYECMNMAALWALPVLFVCINNQYGMGTRIDQAAASTDLCARATAFGLAARRADGGNVEDVRQAAETLVTGARASQPGFLEVSCYRFYGHARMDKSPYRDPKEEEKGRQVDPVAAARIQLQEAGLVTQAQFERMDQEIAREMDESIEFAEAAAAPQRAEMFDDVFAPGQTPPEPVSERIARVLGAR